MEPLNLMVSLSHFGNDKRENEHGLSERVDAGRRSDSQRRRGRVHGWWRNGLRGVAKPATTR
jgi:hypothetical protein